MPSRSLYLPIVCAVYVAYRAWLLAVDFDAVSIPSFELGLMGNFAHLSSSGSSALPLSLYYDNCGGHLTTGLLAVPFYTLLGSSYLALKLVPLSLGLGSLLLIWFILSRVFGRRAAVAATLLFTLAPPTLLKYSLLAKGNHFENLFFQLSALALFVQAHRNPRSRGWLVAFGLASAFSVWFYFGSLILMLALVGAQVWLRGPRAAVRDGAWMLPGWLLGTTPILWIHWMTSGRELSFLSSKFPLSTTFDWSRAGARIGELWLEVLPHAAAFDDVGRLPGRWIDLTFFALTVTAWIALAPRLGSAVRSRRPATLQDAALAALWLYLPAFTLLYAVSTFDFDYYAPPVEVGRFRYLVPHLMITTMLVAVLFQGGASGARPRHWAFGAAALAVCALGAGVLSPGSGWRGAARAYPGHHLRYLANLLMRSHSPDAHTGALVFDYERILANSSGLGPVERREVLLGVGYYAAWAQILPMRAGAERTLDLDAILAPFPLESRPHVARGVGSCMRRLLRLRERGRELLAELAEDVHARGHPAAPRVAEGLCLDFAYTLSRRSGRALHESVSIYTLLPNEWRPHLRHGLGMQCGELYARAIPQDQGNVRAVVRSLRAQADDGFWRGVGVGMGGVNYASEGVSDALLHWVPDEHREAFLIGLKGATGDSPQTPGSFELYSVANTVE